MLILGASSSEKNTTVIILNQRKMRIKLSFATLQLVSHYIMDFKLNYSVSEWALLCGLILFSTLVELFSRCRFTVTHDLLRTTRYTLLFDFYFRQLF